MHLWSAFLLEHSVDIYVRIRISMTWTNYTAFGFVCRTVYIIHNALKPSAIAMQHSAPLPLPARIKPVFTIAMTSLTLALFSMNFRSSDRAATQYSKPILMRLVALASALCRLAWGCEKSAEAREANGPWRKNSGLTSKDKP